MERLALRLSEVVRSPLPDSLETETVILPGAGLAHWLSQALSRNLGVWSNARYLYPQPFATCAGFWLQGPTEALKAARGRENLVWHVLAELRPLLSRPEFTVLERYLRTDSRGLRYLDLCWHIADVFERYRAYRPDWLQRWQEPPPNRRAAARQMGLFDGVRDGESWQALLWRRLASRIQNLSEAGSSGDGADGSALVRELGPRPTRLCALGLGHLPPHALSLLVTLSKQLPVHFFQLTAAPSLTADARATDGTSPSPAPLVQALGSASAAFSALVAGEVERQGARVLEHALFEAPRGPSALEHLQRRLIEHAAVDTPDTVPSPLPIMIHACHGRLREVEVLHDQLTDLLTGSRGVRPEEIVVLSPDIEAYAPYIDAVFQRTATGGAAREQSTIIPYSIADRGPRACSELVDGLSRVVDLVGSRLSAPSVLDLLRLALVSDHFGVADRDLDLIHRWVAESNIRWGLDGAHKASHGHPNDDLTSWRFGLTRLLLGYACSDDLDHLVAGQRLAPVSSGNAVALGRFSHFAESLFEVLQNLEGQVLLTDWRSRLLDTARNLFANDPERAWQHQALESALDELSARATQSGFQSPLSVQAVWELALAALKAHRPNRGFLVGGVTFGTLVPLRSIPFRVVCLLGLSDRAFPRHDVVPEFDLMQQSPPQPGDRSRLLEDRQVLLEALLSAREQLLITYDGQSIRDNSKLPPSVLLSELLDHLPSSSYTIVEHPLQPFSARYFDNRDEALFSFQGRYLAGAESASGARTARPALLEVPLPDAGPVTLISLEDLAKYLAHPLKWIARERLGLRLDTKEHLLHDREPHNVDNLTRWRLGDELLRLLLEGRSEQEAWQLVYASGALPRSRPSELWREELLREATPIARVKDQLSTGGLLPDLEVELELGTGLVLQARLAQRYRVGLVRHQFSRVAPRHTLPLWLEHLAYAAASGVEPEAQRASILVGGASRKGRDGALPVLYHLRASLNLGALEHADSAVSTSGERSEEAARRTLAALAQLYVGARSWPLPFAPGASQAYAEALREDPKDTEKAWDRAQSVWKDDGKFDAYRHYFLGDVGLADWLGESGKRQFEELARTICGPLVAHLQSAPLTLDDGGNAVPLTL
jgi:exodeoxyribonuclease V gamma subunit